MPSIRDVLAARYNPTGFTERAPGVLQGYWDGTDFRRPPVTSPVFDRPVGAPSTPAAVSGAAAPPVAPWSDYDTTMATGPDQPDEAPGVDLPGGLYGGPELAATPENIAGVLGGMAQFGATVAGVPGAGIFSGVTGVGPSWGDYAAGLVSDPYEAAIPEETQDIAPPGQIASTTPGVAFESPGYGYEAPDPAGALGWGSEDDEQGQGPGAGPDTSSPDAGFDWDDPEEEGDAGAELTEGDADVQRAGATHAGLH